MKWISVKDRLPEVGQIVVAWMDRQKEPVIVRIEIDELGIIWRELIKVNRFSDRYLDSISHWIPLPEPPNET